MTLGGGIGWLGPLAGLTCDNLLSAQIVTSSGDMFTVSADEHPELFWAIRGGGGNFGVVTEFVFRLHPVGPMVNLGLFFWGLESAADGLRFARGYAEAPPAGTSVFVAGLSAPPAPFVPEQFHFRPGFALVVVGFGTPDEHAAAVAPIREAVPPLFEFVTPIPYTGLQSAFDASAPWGMHSYEKSLYLNDFSEAAIDVLVEHLPLRQSPLSFVPIFRLDGAYLDVDDSATAFSGPRRPCWMVNVSATCPDPAMFEGERAWVRSFWQALLPHSTGGGGYINFMVDQDQDRIRTSYGEAKYDRLAAVKAQYDPDNVFHHNVNIRPRNGAAS